MILRRVGRKEKLASKLISMMPEHNIYMEPFFGSGSIFFNKPLATHNYLNDSDEDVYNLFNVLMNDKDNLYQRILDTPYHKSQFEYFRKTKDLQDVERAVQFLFLSNYTYLGKADCLKFGAETTKKQLVNEFQSNLIDKLRFAMFNNVDFRKFFTEFSFKSESIIPSTFIFCDPPYVNTADNYAHSFKEQDARDLLDILTSKKWKFMYCEFLTPLTEKLAQEYKLNIIPYSERQTLKSRNTEIILTNYEINQGLF